jgi:patatin-like phospholipase/acyl hydrolase
MKPLRRNVALAIDGGGIRGTIVAKALAVVEESEKMAFAQRARLFSGTSTGSVISAGFCVGLSAARMHELYRQFAREIFPSSLRSRFWYFFSYRYSNQPLIDALRSALGDKTMGDLWAGRWKKDLVIVLRDLVENRNLFVKPWKQKYRDWPIWKAVLASSTVPTYFPVVDGRYVDGGVGSYANPCYIAAYEIANVLQDWKLEETTLISLGTGSAKTGLNEGEANGYHVWDWVGPILDAFTVDAARQQVDLVHRFFDGLDFRRFQVQLTEGIAMDDVGSIDKLTEYGEKLGQKILDDQWEPPEAPQVLTES